MASVCANRIWHFNVLVVLDFNSEFPNASENVRIVSELFWWKDKSSSVRVFRSSSDQSRNLSRLTRLTFQLTCLVTQVETWKDLKLLLRSLVEGCWLILHKSLSFRSGPFQGASLLNLWFYHNLNAHLVA